MQLVGWSRLTLHGRGTSRAMAAAVHEHRAHVQSMLSAATCTEHAEHAESTCTEHAESCYSNSHQEGAWPPWLRPSLAGSDARIAAQTSEISWSYLAKANCIFD